MMLALFLLLAILQPVFSEEDKETTAKASGFGTLKDPSELKALKYRLIGPAWGGRVSRAAGIPGDPNTYYFAGAASGVWKSIDGGYKWKSVFDDQPISSIGSLAIAASDPNIIYVGSGEANPRGNVAAGNGIYKSGDAGKTWTHVWKQEGQIGTMVVHPTNPDIAFAAVLGHAFGPNPERGVYRTRDGGKTWQQVLKKDPDTGASDVAMDASNPNVLYAGLWQIRRQPWIMSSGGPGSGLYISRDGGDTWKQLKGNGLPEGTWGKVGVAVAPSDGSIVYALIEAEKGGIFRSDDGGDNWTLASPNRLLRQRAWYYSTITINPTNPNEVWVPQVPMMKSIDGGRTWNFVSGIPHGDNHDLWIDPKNPKRMIGADDGGVNLTLDGGQSWFAPALPLGQFYHVSVDTRVPFHVAGAMQDIGTSQAPNRSLTSDGIRNGDWYSVGGGEAGWVVSNTADPNLVYAGEYMGIITQYDHRTQQAQNITIYPENASGHGGEDLKYRFQWTAPIAVSPHNPKVVYHGGNVLFRTDNAGQTWTPISPDLTRNDKSKQKWSGGPITGDNTGVEIFCTIFAVAESPVQKDLIWAGSDDGLVHITTDGGKNWKNVTAGISGFPEWSTVSMIEPSRFDAATAYIVVDAHRLDNMKPYLYRTTDFGKSWKRLDAGLPPDIYLHAVREDPTQKDLLYVGTERGVAFTKDGGKTWQSLKLNMPTVAVHDLAVKDSNLVVGTMGRSIYVFDHLNVLRELSPEVTAKSFHLFTSPDAIRWRLSYAVYDRWAGENPAGLATIYYWLKDPAKEDIKIEILDSQGKIANTLSSKQRAVIGSYDNLKEEQESLKKQAIPKDAGVQVAPYNLTYYGAEVVPNAKLDGGDPTEIPYLIPGTYTVKLTVGGQSQTTTLKVTPDTRLSMTEAQYKEQMDFAFAFRDDFTRLSRLIIQLQSIRKQLLSRSDLLKGNAAAAQLMKDSENLIAKLNDREAKMQNPKAEVSYDILSFEGGARLYTRMSFLWSTISGADGVPTQGMRELYADQKKELDGYDSDMKQFIATDLSSLNTTAKKLDLPIVIAQ